MNILQSLLKIAFILSLSSPAFSADNERICNMMINDYQFNSFLSMREFLVKNPYFIQTHNPNDLRYCANLKHAYREFPKKVLTANEMQEIYNNCMQLNESQLYSEYESFSRIKETLGRCYLF